MSKRKTLFEEEKKTRPKLRRPHVPPRPRLKVARPELKFHTSGVDYFGAGRLLGATLNYNDCSDSVFRLNLLTEGTDRDNRIGRKVHLKKLVISAWLFNEVGAGDVIPANAKMVVWLDKDATAPSSTAILNVYEQESGSNAVNYNLLRNMSDPARYKVLAIKDFGYIGGASNTFPFDQYPSDRHAEAQLTLDLPCTYPGTGTSPNDNLLMVTFITNTLQSTGFNPKIVFKARVWFEDK